MTIDAATLPSTEAGATLTKDQLFTIRGSGFEYWPDGLVLGYSEGNVTDSDETVRNMVLEGKSSERLIFRVQDDYTYQQAHTWDIIGTPLSAPRNILVYTKRET